MAHTSTPLAELIASKGLSVHGLADASGVPNTTLRRHLRDGDFRVTELRRIAQALGVSPALILSLAEQSTDQRDNAAA